MHSVHLCGVNAVRAQRPQLHTRTRQSEAVNAVHAQCPLGQSEHCACRTSVRSLQCTRTPP
eukprot:6538270-Prymnesium_polylepis.1